MLRLSSFGVDECMRLCSARRFCINQLELPYWCIASLPPRAHPTPAWLLVHRRFVADMEFIGVLWQIRRTRNRHERSMTTASNTVLLAGICSATGLSSEAVRRDAFCRRANEASVSLLLCTACMASSCVSYARFPYATGTHADGRSARRGTATVVPLATSAAHIYNASLMVGDAC